MKTGLKNIPMLFAATLGLLICGLPAGAQSAAFFDALKYYHEGNASEAAKLFVKEISDNPQNDAAYYYYACLLLDSGNKADAPNVESNLKKAIELDQENYWYKYKLASFYQQTDRPELCSALLEELLAGYPRKSDLYFDAANTYLQQNNVDKAIETIDKIARIGGKNEMICLTKMELLIKKNGGNENEAYKYLEEYYKDCKTPRLASMLGDWYHATYRDSLALDCYDQAIELDRGYSPAYYGRAHIYQQMRRYDNYFSDIRHFLTDASLPAQGKAKYFEGLMEMPQFIMAFQPEMDSLIAETGAVHPDDSILNNTVSLYYYGTGRKDSAVAAMQRNVTLYPDSYTIGFQYLLIRYYIEDWNGVVDYATVLLQKWPAMHDPLLVRASAFRQLGNLKSAIEDYEAMAATAPKDSSTIIRTYPSLGDLYFEDGNVRKAFKCYEKALKADPENALVLNNYAYYMSLGKVRLKKAREMSKKTIEKEPDNPTYLDTYAWILHLMGQDVEAKAIFKHAMIYGGKEQAAILDHYAEVLYSLKEYDLAFIYWGQARALLDGSEAEKIDRKVKERKEQLNAK